MKCPICGEEMYVYEKHQETWSHNNRNCRLGFRVWTAYELHIIEDAVESVRHDALEEAATQADRMIGAKHREIAAAIRALAGPEEGRG